VEILPDPDVMPSVGSVWALLIVRKHSAYESFDCPVWSVLGCVGRPADGAILGLVLHRPDKHGH
tara:strand:+ start:585 stop:776 length:192 start_codon:yes stop_codon:yes gene_type:complete